MSEIRLGVVGYGAIGRMLADMATLLGSRVTFYDPYAPDATGEVGRAESIEQLFAASDVISLHSPPSPDGKPLVTKELLDLLPSGSILINTARETLADSSAVLSALDSGQLAAFALDAFESEPPVLTDLFRHDRTILTPHVGAYTSSSVSRAVSYAANNLVVFLQEHEA
jgi:D-3-phosphoglycerate dehydrogenase